MKNDLKLERIRLEIDLLKGRLDNINQILNTQEELLDHLADNTKSLLSDTISKTSLSETMKNAFTGKRIPGILNQ